VETPLPDLRSLPDEAGPHGPLVVCLRLAGLEEAFTRRQLVTGELANEQKSAKEGGSSQAPRSFSSVAHATGSIPKPDSAQP